MVRIPDSVMRLARTKLGAWFLDVTAPLPRLVLRCCGKDLPRVSGIKLLVCDGEWMSSQVALERTLAELVRTDPASFTRVTSLVQLLHVAEQPEWHGRYDTRLKTGRFDVALLQADEPHALALRVARW